MVHMSDVLDHLQVAQIDELEEEEFSDSRMLDEYRKKRVQELKEKVARERFGELTEIVKDEWVREVTECSESCAVVTHLYQDSLIDCQVMDEHLRKLAPKFKYVKFLRIKSDQAIENWPEKNLPSLFIYTNGALKTQLMTLNALGGKSCSAEDLEWYLVCQGIITDSELECNPQDLKKAQTVYSFGKAVRTPAARMTGLDSDDDIDDDDNY